MSLEEKRIYKIVIVGFGIIILILLLCLLSTSYEEGVQKCINAGNNESYCREGLK